MRLVSIPADRVRRFRGSNTALAVIVVVALTSGRAQADALIYRSTTAGKIDPAGVWSPSELKTDGGTSAKVFTYSLVRGSKTYTVSQVWNEVCAQRTCPTRVVMTEPSGTRRVLLTDDMQQIIPPNDPRYAGTNTPFARTPFDLSTDGKTLTAGPDTFELPQ